MESFSDITKFLERQENKEGRSFIIGVVLGEGIKQFPDKKTADWEADEWCEVFAENLDEAIRNYETAFDAWQEKENQTN